MLDDTVYRYEMPNGDIVSLTSRPGMQESISLQSTPWRYVDYQKSNVQIVSTNEGTPCAFKIIEGAESKIITHEAIFKILCGDVLNSSDYLVGYPNMLPNFGYLDLRKMVECEIGNNPEIWNCEISEGD